MTNEAKATAAAVIHDQAEDEVSVGLVVMALWTALSHDDDETVRRLFMPEGLQAAVGLEAGCAARFRGVLGKSRRDCARMKVELGKLQFPGLSVPAYLVASTQRGVGPGRGIRLVTPLLVVQFEGAWRVWGTAGLVERVVEDDEPPSPAIG